MDAQYRILFSGNLLPGQEPLKVAERLAPKFSMSEDAARELILKGRARILKQNLTAAEAERYRSELTVVGMVVMVEPQDLLAVPGAESAHEPVPDALTAGQPLPTLKKTTESSTPKRSVSGDGWTRCPKCGASEVSELTGVCQACGVVAERYLETHGSGSTAGARDNQNRSRPLLSDLTLSPGNEGLLAPRSVPIGRGWGWIADAWTLFKDRPWAWIGAVLLFYLILIILSLVPVLGALATTILGPMLSAGLMMGAHAQSRGEGFVVSHLFVGVLNKPGPLALVGLVYLLLAIGIGLVVTIIVVIMASSTGIEMDAATMDPDELDTLMAMSPLLLLPLLIVFFLSVPLTMAMFFAPSLVLLNDVPVLRAFKLSFFGCLKNILPFLVFALIAIALVLLGSIPFMLGLILVLPILTISIYTAYQDIFLFGRHYRR